MNKRKELMISKHIHPDDEIRLLNLVFTIPKHSKSAVAWYHRQWIVTNYDCVQVQNEMKLCEMTCCFYKRNYYSWSYRFWILSRHQQEHTLVEKEYRTMLSWCELNISDYSGFHYLEQVMNLMNWKLCLKDQHMKWLNNLTIKFPGHESIWCHRRYCSNLYYTKDYCISQHQFVWDILNDKYMEQALEMTRLDEQRQFALKFGLWLSILEKRRCHDQYASLIDSKLIYMYRKTTPDSTLLDRQG
ncbi:hypothetical protein BCV72DRAFT_232320 [Rhizopus microsporus var. microsporus]|uniref:Protein prenylyltransferase n=2 Tax=Rhizopus microsporus TaxID=58291 RepID=A0A2G4SJ70_RHIZD|nr:uncharacterized protein RHIMIDRAFT_267836 [Rhizopus microsporus ATCC 52813]ORE03941.1 hypothetical protein BCV72DRAFT_232320 [Rhizopus microsporus var. microsporus]PHZ08828.1 hypothetical protein RHIMIDRAFT_267836 [Rhizopus microsporus ATCC 52813]